MDNIIKQTLVLPILALAACAGIPSKVQRQPSQNTGVALSEVVKKSASSEAFCPTAKEGEVCLMTWVQALSYCQSQGTHLPTAREYAESIKRLGTRTLEVGEVNGSPASGFYLVDCKNPDGTLDAFYMNHSAYQRPAEDTVNYLLWTSSIPPQHPEYAHVYYNEWGGGGGNPQDHRLTHSNAVQCVSSH